jgi:hypothetical protein
LEHRVFEGLRRRLLAPESIAQLVIEYSVERARLHELDKRARGELAKRITLAKQRIERLVDAIAAGTATRATCERLIAEEAECARMEQEQSNMEARARSVIELHPRAIAQYQERVAALTDNYATETSSARRSPQFFVALSIASTLRRYQRVAK